MVAPSSAVSPASIQKRVGRRNHADPPMLRALTQRGLPLPQRIFLSKAELSPELRMVVARARFELGRIYWRAVDVDEAVALLSARDATFNVWIFPRVTAVFLAVMGTGLVIKGWIAPDRREVLDQRSAAPESMCW